MEILQPADPGAEDRIVVEAVLVVMPGPAAADLERSKAGTRSARPGQIASSKYP